MNSSTRCLTVSLLAITVRGDRHALDQLHDKKNGRPSLVLPASENMRDARMIHHCQRLALGLEAGNDGRRNPFPA